MQDKITYVDGKKVYIREFGDKSKNTIVYFGGWVQVFEPEEEFIKLLAEKYHVIIIFWPGYLQSEENIKATEIGFLSSLVNKVLAELLIAQYSILAYSMGCQIALNYREIFGYENKMILIEANTRPYSENVNDLLLFFLGNNFAKKACRMISPIRSYLVNVAYKFISQGSRFNNKNVSFTGAFDTLYAQIFSKFIDPLQNTKNVFYIYGNEAEYEKVVNTKDTKVTLIKNGGHYFFHKQPEVLFNQICEFLTSVQ